MVVPEVYCSHLPIRVDEDVGRRLPCLTVGKHEHVVVDYHRVGRRIRELDLPGGDVLEVVIYEHVSCNDGLAVDLNTPGIVEDDSVAVVLDEVGRNHGIRPLEIEHGAGLPSVIHERRVDDAMVIGRGVVGVPIAVADDAVIDSTEIRIVVLADPVPSVAIDAFPRRR